MCVYLVLELDSLQPQLFFTITILFVFIRQLAKFAIDHVLQHFGVTHLLSLFKQTLICLLQLLLFCSVILVELVVLPVYFMDETLHLLGCRHLLLQSVFEILTHLVET